MTIFDDYNDMHTTDAATTELRRASDLFDVLPKTLDAFSATPTTITSNKPLSSMNTQPYYNDDHSSGYSGPENYGLLPSFAVPRTPLFLVNQYFPDFGTSEFQSNLSSVYRSSSTSTGTLLSGVSGSLSPGLSRVKSERCQDWRTKALARPSLGSYQLCDSTPLARGTDLCQQGSPEALTTLFLPTTFDNDMDNFAPFVSFDTPIPAQSGFVADVNMFDRDEVDSLFVRPSDLLGQLPESPPTGSRERSPSGVDSSTPPGTDSTVSTFEASPSNKDPNPEQNNSSCHEDCLDQLPLLVEQYLQKFAPLQKQEVTDHPNFLLTPHVPISGLAPYSPLTSELLAAVEETQALGLVRPPARTDRKKLGDITNSSAKINDCVGVNLMHLSDMPIPQDVVISKAHGGVHGASAAQKTKFFMMENPGKRLSEELLFTFAGRLSADGEQISGYRCYIQGCTKATKRKDHMGDHVRTHLGEKPYLCSVCGMGFIRNNDRLRHENNHKPEKKFVCSCNAAFSRRDLFVRHQKTACGLGSGSGVWRRRSKGSKSIIKRQGTPGGDDREDGDYIPEGMRFF